MELVWEPEVSSFGSSRYNTMVHFIACVHCAIVCDGPLSHSASSVSGHTVISLADTRVMGHDNKN